MIPWLRSAARSVLLFASMLVAASEGAGQPLRVVTTPVHPFFYEENGEPAGIEYDILQFFARSQERELQIQWVDSFKEVLPTLARGGADIASSAITITKERGQHFDFSSSYFPSQLVLVERSGEQASDPKDLAGARIGALAGSTSIDALSKTEAVIVPIDDIRDGYAAVAAGELHGVVTQTARALLLLEEFDSLAIGLHLGEIEEFGFAVRKGSLLAQALSEHLTRIKGSGIYFRLLKEHLGPQAAAIVQSAQP